MKYTYKQTIYAGYVGYVTQAVVNNLAPLLFLILKEAFGLNLRQLTWITAVNFFVQMLVDLLSARFVDRIGYRKCVIAAHLFAALGLIGLALLPQVFPPYAGMLIAVVCYAVGGGLIEVLISPIVEACPTEDKVAAMGLLHSFYCWGTVVVILLSTLFLRVFGTTHWKILCCLWAIVPLCNAVFFAQVPINHLTETGKSMTIRQLCASGLFWIFMLLMITAGASEQAMSQWASAFAESGLHVSKTVGDLAGPCLFSVLMGISRVFYSKLSGKIRLLPYLICCAALCIGAYLLTALSPHPALALLGCGICGLSVGVMWPGVFSLASVSCPRGGTALFALMALAGDVGCSGGPSLVGFLSAACGDELRFGLMLAVVFPVLLIFGAMLCGRSLRKNV